MAKFNVGRAGDAKFEIDVASLTKHTIVLGATGSGKTVLSKVLVEEAALQGIPTFAIDPKGDIGNLAFKSANFDFSKWSEKEADALKIDRKEYVSSLRNMYTDRMKEFSVAPDAPTEFANTVTVRIFTPKSSAGLPVGISPDLSPPKDFAGLLHSDMSAAADLLDLTSYNLLRLAGYGENDRKEVTFVSALIEDAWKSGHSLTVNELIRRIENPTISTIGSLHVSDVLGDKDRHKLSTKINLLISDPKLRSWSAAKSLDFSELMTGPSINILDLRNIQSEQEKRLFVELVLQQLFQWLIKQGSAQTLRYLLYFDEIAGYCPPVREPPSKKLLLLLIKQARAFGLGLILASQNAVDLDYKVISNANVRFIGRLGAQRDIQRVSVGLELDAFAEKEISRLKAGEFFCNTFDPKFRGVIKSRWTLTYHRGPLESGEIAELMEDIKEEEQQPSKPAVQDENEEEAESTESPPTIPRSLSPSSSSSSSTIVAVTGTKAGIKRRDGETALEIERIRKEEEEGQGSGKATTTMTTTTAASTTTFDDDDSLAPTERGGGVATVAETKEPYSSITFMQLEKKFEPKNLQNFASLGNNLKSIKVLSTEQEEVFHPVFELSASVFEKSYAKQSLDRLEELAAFQNQLIPLPADTTLMSQRTVLTTEARHEVGKWRGELEKRTATLKADLQAKFDVIMEENRIERLAEKQAKPKSKIADIDSSIERLQEMLNAELDSIKDQEKLYKALKKEKAKKSRLISTENRIETKKQRMITTRRKIEQLNIDKQALEDKLVEIEENENEKFHEALAQVRSKSSFALTGWLVETMYRARIIVNDAKEHSGDVRWSAYTGRGTWGRCYTCSVPLEVGSACSCGNLMCNSHFAYCKTCMEPACMDHRTLCYICKSTFCARHSIKCELCGSFACSINHSAACNICSRKICNNCSQKKGFLKREIVCRLCSPG